MEASEEVPDDGIGSGEPTPLWQLPLIVAGLSAFVLGLTAVLDDAGWDAALRVTGGCLLVGLAQALLLGGSWAPTRRGAGRVYFRRPGSRILRGTELGHVRA